MNRNRLFFSSALPVAAMLCLTPTPIRAGGATSQPATSPPASPAPATPKASLSEPAPPSIKWTRSGASSGRPLIFIPALALEGSVWSNVYKEFEKDHPVYSITLAGTVGIPPTKPPYMDRIVEDLHKMIETEKLDKPVVIGHLLGGHVALRLAGQYPDSIKGTLAIPIPARRPPLDRRAAVAAATVRMYRDTRPEMWEPTMRLYIKRGCENPDVTDQLTAMAARADRDAFVGVLEELLTDNIERHLPNIRTPVLLVGTVRPPGALRDVNVRDRTITEASNGMLNLLRSGFPGIEKCDVETIKNSQIFTMYDDPTRITRLLGRFLARLDNPSTVWGTTKDVAAAAPTPRDTTTP